MRFLPTPLITLACIGVFAAGGCTKQNSDPRHEDPPAPYSELSQEPEGAFTATGPTTASLSERYAAGCSTAGQPSGDFGLDPRTKVAMKFVIRETIASPKQGTMSITMTREIRDRSADTILSNIVVDASSFPGVAPGRVFDETCKLTTIHEADSDGQKYSCDAEPKKIDPGFTGCYLESSSANTKHTETKGELRQPSRAPVVAYRIVETSTGTIKCGKNGTDDKIIGTGKQEWTRILTNDTPAGNLLECGGSEVFSHDKLMNDAGEVVEIRRREQLSVTN